MSKELATWLSTKEAALYTGFSPRTLINWRNKGIGPKFNKVGRSVRYNVKDLDNFVRGEN